MNVPSTGSFFGGTAASFCYDKTCFWTRKAARSVLFKIFRHKKPPLPGLPIGPPTRAQRMHVSQNVQTHSLIIMPRCCSTSR